MTLAVVAPAAPAIPWALFALSSAIAFIVSWGLLHGWGATFGRLFQWLGNKGLDITLKAAPDIHIHPFRFLLSLDQQVRHGLSVAVAASEHAMVTSFHRLVGIIIWSAQETAGLAQDIYDAIRGAKTTVTTTITKTLDAKTTALINKINGTVGALIHVTVPHIEHQIAALVHRLAAIAHTIPHGVVALPARVGITSKQLRRLARRTEALEKRTVGLGAVALVTAALVRMGFKWIKCDSAKSVGRRLNCGSFQFLESLLSLAVEALIITNLCQTTKLLTRIGVAAQPMIVKLTTGVADLMRCQGAGALPLLPLASFTLPDVEGDGLTL